MKSATVVKDTAVDLGVDAEPTKGIIASYWARNGQFQALSLPEQIAAQIGDSILAEKRKPGERLTEQELSDEFEASRGPVREALRILEREGLVQIHSRRGARVTMLTPEEVAEIFEVRASLYRNVFERLARNSSPEIVKILQDSISRLRRLAEFEDDNGAYAATVFRASLGLARAAGNQTLVQIMMSLALRSFRYTRLGLQSQARRRKSLGNWVKMLEAVRKSDGETAANLASQLVQLSRDEALRLLAKSDG
jgi:DNA-binding GntR family transcriptional regulator